MALHFCGICSPKKPWPWSNHKKNIRQTQIRDIQKIKKKIVKFSKDKKIVQNCHSQEKPVTKYNVLSWMGSWKTKKNWGKTSEIWIKYQVELIAIY